MILSRRQLAHARRSRRDRARRRAGRIDRRRARSRARGARRRRRRSRSATSRPTASTPASATSPRCGSRTTRSPQLQVNLLRSHAAGVGDPLPVPVVRATMALRANVLAKGFSGIRVETLELLLVDCSTARVHPRRAVARIGGRERRPRAARPPWRSCSSAKAKRGTTTGVSRVPTALRRAGLDAGHAWRQKKDSRSSTAPSRRRRCSAWRSPGAERLARTGRHRGGDEHRRPAGVDQAVRSAHSRRPRASPASRCPPKTSSSAGRQRHQRRPRQLRPRAGRLFDALRARRCTARRATRSPSRAGTFDVEANAATDNPMVFADTGEIVSGGNFHGAPVALARDVLCLGLAQLATISERRIGSARQSGAQRAAGVPHAARRTAIGTDDGAGDRGRAHVGAEDARASGERGHDSDVGQQGRSRQHEHGRRV